MFDNNVFEYHKNISFIVIMSLLEAGSTTADSKTADSIVLDRRRLACKFYLIYQIILHYRTRLPEFLEYPMKILPAISRGLSKKGDIPDSPLWSQILEDKNMPVFLNRTGRDQNLMKSSSLTSRFRSIPPDGFFLLFPLFLPLVFDDWVLNESSSS